MFVPASTFSCPAVRFRLVMREMFNLRHPYWMPRDVVAEKALLLGVYVWTALAFRVRFRLPGLESSEVPVKPSLGADCRAGGANSALAGLKESAPPSGMKRRECPPDWNAP